MEAIREEIRKENELELSNKTAIKVLAQKYQAIIGWDTSFLFTYNLQELFIENKNLISFEGVIHDIRKQNGIYILKISNPNTDYNDYIAEVKLNANQFKLVQNRININPQFISGSFIIKATDIISISPEIESELSIEGESYDDYEGSYSYIYFDESLDLTIFKGELIDFYFNKFIDIPNDDDY